MDDVKEQYKRELMNQEIKSNQRTVKGFIWFLVVLAVVWLLNVTGFFELDPQMITDTFTLVSVLLVIPVYLFFRGDLSRPWTKYFFLTLMCIVSAILVSFLSFHAVLLYVVPLLFAIQYRRKSTIWFVYVVNTITMGISSLVSFYYGICDLNLLFQSQHTRNWYLNMIGENALNIPFNENPVFVILVFEVFPRSMILLLFSIMMQYTVVSSNEDALRIAQLTYLKETDERTRVFNKNKYFEMVTEYYPGIDTIAAVFWDLNNLKYINDQYGHAEGDKAIERLSFALNRFADDRCRVYRIGGDEFLMILDNPAENEAEDMIKAVRTGLERENNKEGICISSASGLAFGRGKNILRVVEEADTHMYENKKNGREYRE